MVYLNKTFAGYVEQMSHIKNLSGESENQALKAINWKVNSTTEKVCAPHRNKRLP